MEGVESMLERNGPQISKIDPGGGRGRSLVRVVVVVVAGRKFVWGPLTSTSRVRATEQVGEGRRRCRGVPRSAGAIAGVPVAVVVSNLGERGTPGSLYSERTVVRIVWVDGENGEDAEGGRSKETQRWE